MKRIILFLALLPFMVVSANAQSLMVGDANGDGFLDISDVVAVVNRVLEGNPTSYRLCPDFHHPHLIDLGLPSGTLWSCCNVDAKTPQDYGGYYAWGETQTKSQYDLSTYSHYDSTNRYHNLGSDISGTNYDVAHVKWKGYWKMPNAEQFNEIYSYCNYEFTSVEGVRGITFTGPNGGKIFFPNSGAYVGASLSNDNTFGQVWSSTVPPGLERYGAVNGLTYSQTDESVRLLSLNRYHGFTVRPIRNESSCDVNRDGSIDISDVVFDVNRILGGKTAYYDCPDNNHPHMIDLGLPSGTLWSCCNVGASTYWEVGDYFAWGETEAKENYDATTYKYCDDQNINNCHDIGSSIIGTQYDVAHVQWGDSWQMPSNDQIIELASKCEFYWGGVNSVINGYWLRGPNGGRLFLPAAGYYNGSTCSRYNEVGFYWLGQQYSGQIPYATSFSFDVDDTYLYYVSRMHGFPVRPVAK